MANTDIMKLTDKQKMALYNISTIDQLEIVDTIFENIGFVSVKEYSEITGLNTRDIYRLIKSNKVYWRKYSSMYFISLIPKNNE